MQIIVLLDLKTLSTTIRFYLKDTYIFLSHNQFFIYFHDNLFTVWSNYVSLVVLLIFQCFFILSNTMFIYLIYISICLFSHAFFYYFYYFLFLLLLFFHYIFSFIYHKNTRGGEKKAQVLQQLTHAQFYILANLFIHKLTGFLDITEL